MKNVSVKRVISAVLAVAMLAALAVGLSSCSKPADGKDGKDGQTPYIKDGNWWIGETDTGVKAEGETPYVKDGTWWIGETDTGVIAESKTYKPYAHRTFFQVEVTEPTFGTDDTFAILPADTQPTARRTYLDNCVLYLPMSYTPDGAPTKLVIYCKPGAYEIKQNSDPVLDAREEVTKLMLLQGYAILACNGIPEQWRTDLGLNARVVGNPIAPQCVKKAYDYVVDAYNLDTNGAFLYGYSQGGHYALNVAEYAEIPINALLLKSPAVSYQYHQWDLVASANGFDKSARLNIARIFGFPSVTTNDELNALEFNAEYVKGYDPFTRNTIDPYDGFVKSSMLWKLPGGTSVDDITSMTFMDDPIKIWCGTGDTLVSHEVTQVFVKSIRNAGGKAEIRVFEGGDHPLTNLPVLGTVKVPYINVAGVQAQLTANIRIQDYEMLQYMAEHGGYLPYALDGLSNQKYPGEKGLESGDPLNLTTASTYGISLTSSNSKHGDVVSLTSNNRVRSTDLIPVEAGKSVSFILEKDATNAGLAVSVVWWKSETPSHSNVISSTTVTTDCIKGTPVSTSDSTHTTYFKYQMKQGESVTFTNTTGSTVYVSMTACSLASSSSALKASDYTIVHEVK